MLLYQLTRPVAYLIIEDRSKWRIDWLIPAIITIFFVGSYFSLPIPKPLYGDNGIIKELQGFLQMLPGFYLAALAAIATFNKNDLDYHLPSPTPRIEVMINGHEVPINLTRRRMLSYLFGYLTFLSLMLYLLLLSGSAASASALLLFGKYFLCSKFIFLSVVCFFFSQMIIVTIFGLYQLCDRIHQPDQNNSIPPTS